MYRTHQHRYGKNAVQAFVLTSKSSTERITIANEEHTKAVFYDEYDLWNRKRHILLKSETRKGTDNRYWYAYVKIYGKTKKAYVGKTLTKENLIKAFKKLHSY